MRFSRLLIGILLAVIACGGAVIINPPKKTILDFRETELGLLNQRRSFYPSNFLGKLLENKFGVYSSHYLTNISYGLDINFYFFASHPRERLGYTEFQRLPVWLLPFFLFGIFTQLKRHHYVLTVYYFTSLFIVSFFVPFDNYAYVLYPFFILSSFSWLIK